MKCPGSFAHVLLLQNIESRIHTNSTFMFVNRLSSGITRSSYPYSWRDPSTLESLFACGVGPRKISMELFRDTFDLRDVRSIIVMLANGATMTKAFKRFCIDMPSEMKLIWKEQAIISLQYIHIIRENFQDIGFS